MDCQPTSYLKAINLNQTIQVSFHQFQLFLLFKLYKNIISNIINFFFKIQ